MFWVPVALVGFFVLVGPWILAIGAWVRAQDAQAKLLLQARRIAELEARAGIVRRPAARQAAAGLEPSEAESEVAPADRTALEDRIAVVWFSRIGVGILLLGVVWFLFAPGQQGLSRLAVGGAAGLGTLLLVELGRQRTRRLYNQALLAMGTALLLATAVAGRNQGIFGLGTTYAAFAAIAVLGALTAVRHRSEPPLVVAVLGILAAPVLLRHASPAPLAFAWVTVLAGLATVLAGRLGAPWAAGLAVSGTAALYLAWSASSLAQGTAEERLVATAAFSALLALWLLAHAVTRDRDRRRGWPTALMVAALSVVELGYGVALSPSPAVLVAFMAAVAAAGALMLHRERQPAWLGVPLLVAAAAMGEPVVARGWSTAPLATTLALAAWCAVCVPALLRPRQGQTQPSRRAIVLAGVAEAIFLFLDGGVLAPHLPPVFSLVLALFAAVQLVLWRRLRSPELLAIGGVVSAGGLVGASLHVPGSGSALLVACGAVWALVWIVTVGTIVLRRDTPGRVELAAGAGAAAVFALVAAIIVPPGSTLLLAASVTAAAAVPLWLGLALRAGWPRASPALLAQALVLFGCGVLTVAGGALGTVIWAAGATALVSIGFAAHTVLLRRFGLALFAGALLKLAAWDMWRLSRAYQVVVFVVMGALLLLTSYLYARRGRAAPESPAAAARRDGPAEVQTSRAAS